MKTLKVQPVALCLFGLFFLARETETNSQGEKKKSDDQEETSRLARHGTEKEQIEKHALLTHSGLKPTKLTRISSPDSILCVA